MDRSKKIKQPEATPRPREADDAPLTVEDLIGDLDPGWLDWRRAHEGR